MSKIYLTIKSYMKKIIVLSSILAAMLSCTTTQVTPIEKKVELGHIIVNKNFDSNSKLPDTISQELLKQGVKTYTVGVLKGDIINSGEFLFNEPFFVRTSFYSYSTVRSNESMLNTRDDENRIIFKEKVTFKDKSTINLRVNTSENLSDLLIFENIESQGKLYLNVKNSGIDARFLKIPIIEVPKTSKVDIELFEPLIVNDVNYVLETSYTNTSKIISLAPKFKTSDIANEYREKEINNQNKNEIYSMNKKQNNVYLREKITLFVDKDMVGNSHIVDIVTR